MHDVPEADRLFPPEDAAERPFAPARGPQAAIPALEDYADDFLAEEPQLAPVPRVYGPRVAAFVPAPAPPEATGRRAAVKTALAVLVVLLLVGIGVVVGYTIAQRMAFGGRATPQDAAVVPPPPGAPPAFRSPAVSPAPSADGQGAADAPRAGAVERDRSSVPSGANSTPPSVRPETTKTTQLPVISTPRGAGSRPVDPASRRAASNAPPVSPPPRPAPAPPPQTTTGAAIPGLALTTEPWKPAGDSASSVKLSPPPTAAPAPGAPAPVTARAPDRSADNTEAAIRVVLDGYRQAYNKRDADSVGAVWPSANTKALAKAFSQLSDQRLTFDSCVIGATGPKAQASCAGTAMYVPTVGNRSPHLDTRHWTFRLEQVRGIWVIASAESR